MQGMLDDHYDRVMTALVDGRVVPFFGAGVNSCSREVDVPWQLGGAFFPSGSELSEYLAAKFGYPGDDRWDLTRVAQYVSTMLGPGPLYSELRKVFKATPEPTQLHRFFARLPGRLRRKDLSGDNPLIVTTNYDDLTESAFVEAGDPFDLVIYEVEDKVKRGKFRHISPDGTERWIEKPNKYPHLPLDDDGRLVRAVILKIHGAIDRANAARDNYVITEDHYIDYLTRTDISHLVPVTLAQKLGQSHFLFLGYSLRDWNLRAILHQIWGEQRLSFNSWSVQLHPQPLEQKFWDKRNVEILDVSLQDYIAALNDRLGVVSPTESLG